MDIQALTNVSSNYIKNAYTRSVDADKSFGDIFQTALHMLNETNNLQNSAESAEIQFALGDSDNTHDLQIAQEKANVALSYSVAVRDKLLEGYNTIMNMQI